MKVLLAHDGSADARAALDLMIGWLPRTDDAYAVLAVVPSLPVFGAELEPPDPAPSLVGAAELIVGEAAQRLGAAGHRASTLVRLGKPTEEILGAADAVGADLVVLGARGVGRVRRFLLGSVAERVAQHATRSVLVVRGPTARVESAVIGIDGASATAAETLARLPLPRPLRAHVVAVLPPGLGAWGVHPAARSSTSAEWREAWQAQEAAAGTTALAVRDRLQAAEIATTVAIVRGNEARAIVEAARERAANLVVVGRHEREGDGEPLLGSVAFGVLTNAPCSVLIGPG